jgi:hypothetical protein
VKTPGIPPTAVGGLFKSSLQQSSSTRTPNPTHGSGWIVQVQPNDAVLNSFSSLSGATRGRGEEKKPTILWPPFVGWT